MPEIFIPLRHLTTTLEVLGKILFMKNDLTEAKACLERACPLMELLPSDQNHYATTCFNLLREVYNNSSTFKNSIDFSLMFTFGYNIL
jgi:hypothetical protein